MTVLADDLVEAAVAVLAPWGGTARAQVACVSRSWGPEIADPCWAAAARTVAELTDIGFHALRPLHGGVASLCFEGLLNGRPAVAKISPAVDLNCRQVEAIRRWGPDVTPQVLAASGFWMVVDHGGTGVDVASGDMWAAQLAVLENMVVPALGSDRWPAPHEAFTTMVARCRRRDIVRVNFGDAAIDQLEADAATLAELAAIMPATVCHWDIHDRNWVRDRHGRMRVIDPDPHAAPPAADRARWMLGHVTPGNPAGLGPSGVPAPLARAHMLVERGLAPPLLAEFAHIAARKQAASALVHLDVSWDWVQTHLAAADQAIRFLDQQGVGPLTEFATRPLAT